MQPQGHLQVLLNMLQHNLSAQQALDAPRFCISAGIPDDSEDAQDAGCEISNELFLEEGISEGVRDRLREMGHNVEILSGHERALFGRGQVRFLSSPFGLGGRS